MPSAVPPARTQSPRPTERLEIHGTAVERHNGYLRVRLNGTRYYMKDREGGYYASEYEGLSSTVFQIHPPRADSDAVVVTDEWRSQSGSAARGIVRTYIYSRGLLRSDQSDWIYVPSRSGNTYLLRKGAFLHKSKLRSGDQVTVTVRGTYLDVRYIQDGRGRVVWPRRQRTNTGSQSPSPGNSPQRRSTA